jgi:hypothetical protein
MVFLNVYQVGKIMHLGLKSLAAATAAMLTAVTAASAAVVGVTVDPGDNSAVGVTEFRAALGGDAVKYFITLEDDDGVYGVDDSGDFGLVADSGNGGGTLSMFLLFSPVNIGAEYNLEVLFEDLDLDGGNDPAGFLESVEVFSADGMTSLSGGPITALGGAVSGDSNSQLLTLFLGAISSDPFLIKLNFVASFTSNGTNTPEYLIATINEVPIPAAIPLFLSGIAGFSMAVRRKKKPVTA